MKKITFLILLTLFFAACEEYDRYDCSLQQGFPTTTLISHEKAENIAGIICGMMNSRELIGVQLSIRDSFNQDWNLSMGTIDIEQMQRLENDHVFRIGSVTKIYTSVLIHKLFEEDFLAPDQKLSEFFPDIENARDVNIQHLLKHSSGIRDVFSIPSIFISASNFPDKKWSPRHLAESCLKKDLNFEPGTDYSYSNTNYIILGLIAEEVTGKTAAQLFDEYIFQPGQLSGTFLIPYSGTPLNLINGYVHHYALSLTEWYINEPANTAWSTIAYTAGAMGANAEALSGFIHHLFKGHIIHETTLQEMIDFNGRNGAGIFKINVNGKDYFGHEGEITGFESIAAINPETGLVIAICCNTTPFQINDLLNEIEAEIYKDE